MGEPTASPSDAFSLEVSSTRLRVLAFINDYAIVQNPEGEERVEQRKINAFLLEGKNELRVEVAETDAIGQQRLDVLLSVVRHGDEASARELLRFRHQALPMPLQREGSTQVLRHTFEVSRGLPTWKWQGARPYAGDEDVPAVANLVRRMVDALQRKDAPGLIELLRHKLTEESLATGVDPDATMLEMKEMLQKMMSSPDYVAEASRSVSLLPWCGGRLCDVRADRGQPCVFVTAKDLGLALDTTVSCIDGEWVFAR